MAVKPGESMTVEQRVAVKERALKTLQSDDGVIRLGHVIDAVFDAFEAGRASRDAFIEALTGQRDSAEEECDSLRAQLAEKDAEIARLRAERERVFRDGQIRGLMVARVVAECAEPDSLKNLAQALSKEIARMENPNAD